MLQQNLLTKSDFLPEAQDKKKENTASSSLTHHIILYVLFVLNLILTIVLRFVYPVEYVLPDHIIVPQITVGLLTVNNLSVNTLNITGSQPYVLPGHIIQPYVLPEHIIVSEITVETLTVTETMQTLGTVDLYGSMDDVDYGGLLALASDHWVQPPDHCTKCAAKFTNTCEERCNSHIHLQRAGFSEAYHDCCK